MLGLFSLPFLSSSYAKASESSNSFPDAEAFLSSPSAENNGIDPSVRTGSIYRYRANANPTSLASLLSLASEAGF